jgi:hypothetical protein
MAGLTSSIPPTVPLEVQLVTTKEGWAIPRSVTNPTYNTQEMGLFGGPGLRPMLAPAAPEPDPWKFQVGKAME